MNSTRLLLLVVLAGLWLHGTAFGQSRPSPQAAADNPNKSRQGFFDYALGKVNPDQMDYGAQVAAERAVVVAKTLDNVLFWSNAMALSLFAGVTVLYIFSLRSIEKKELIAASLITELWNGRVSDHAEIARRTNEYNLLVEKHNAALALAASQAAEKSASESRADVRTQRKVERLIEGPRTAATTEQTASGSVGPRKLAAVRDTASAPDLGQQALLLERRIEAMQNTEQNLRERLNQTTALLEQERQRNRTLKGA